MFIPMWLMLGSYSLFSIGATIENLADEFGVELRDMNRGNLIHSEPVSAGVIYTTEDEDVLYIAAPAGELQVWRLTESEGYFQQHHDFSLSNVSSIQNFAWENDTIKVLFTKVVGDSIGLYIFAVTSAGDITNPKLLTKINHAGEFDYAFYVEKSGILTSMLFSGSDSILIQYDMQASVLAHHEYLQHFSGNINNVVLGSTETVGGITHVHGIVRAQDIWAFIFFSGADTVNTSLIGSGSDVREMHMFTNTYQQDSLLILWLLGKEKLTLYKLSSESPELWNRNEEFLINIDFEFIFGLHLEDASYYLLQDRDAIRIGTNDSIINFQSESHFGESYWLAEHETVFEIDNGQKYFWFPPIAPETEEIGSFFNRSYWKRIYIDDVPVDIRAYAGLFEEDDWYFIQDNYGTYYWSNGYRLFSVGAR